MRPEPGSLVDEDLAERHTDLLFLLFEHQSTLGVSMPLRLLGVRTRKEAFGRRLTAGARSGPAEDCGGLPGYERAVEFRRAGNDPWGEGADLAEFLGDWQPDGFDLAEAKAAFDR